MEARKFIVVFFVFIMTACDKQVTNMDSLNDSLLPPEGFVSNATRGAALYQLHCEICHGKNGSGTKNGIALVHKDYSPYKRPNLSFFLAVKRGIRDSARNKWVKKPLENISVENTAHVVRFIREEQLKAGIYTQKRQTTASHDIANLVIQ